MGGNHGGSSSKCGCSRCDVSEAVALTLRSFSALLLSIVGIQYHPNPSKAYSTRFYFKRC